LNQFPTSRGATADRPLQTCRTPRHRAGGDQGVEGGAVTIFLTVGAASAAAQAPASPGAPMIRITGEVGTRAEYIANENFAETAAVRDDDHRFRARHRVRVAGVVPLSEAIEAGVRLSTGDPIFPTSAWVTPAEFRRLPLQIDRAYLGVRVSDALTVRAGAFANPLFTPTEMVWDGDVQPTGLSQVLRPFGPSLTLAAGQYVIRETRSTREANAQSAYLLAQGLSYVFSITGASATVGVSHYYYHNPDVVARSLQVGELDGEFRTNRYDPGGRMVPAPGNPGVSVPAEYFSGFNILNTSARIEAAGVPLSLSADLALNLGARRDPTLGAGFEERENLAFGGMMRYGTLRHPGSYSLGIGYFHIEADAVIAAFNSDDLQQTNVRTVPLELQLALPGRVRLVWDSYLQRKLHTALPSNGGIVHPENALKVRSRISAIAAF
jgi:hypothetical protein